MDGRRSRELDARQRAHPRDLPQPGCPAEDADPALRLRVSDDNPFSEANFKTLKYHPGFPGRFADIDAATGFCRTFFRWYNDEHCHGGIAMLTPADVHFGRAEAMIAQRERTLQQAWTRHPERFVRGKPKPQALSSEVWINRPVEETESLKEGQ